MSLVEWVDFKRIADSRGTLVPIESGGDVPFEIRRVYYLQDLRPNVARGFHAHRALRQVAVCVAGSCRMVLDDGTGREEVVLDRPDRGLLLREMIWHEMSDFSAGCVLLLLASEHYDKTDYIRDYQAFRELSGIGG